MKKSKKPLIIATYILESLKRNDVPTISEVNDIYKFINNKVNGLMLSTEVAVGRAPINVINFLDDCYNYYINDK